MQSLPLTVQFVHPCCFTCSWKMRTWINLLMHQSAIYNNILHLSKKKKRKRNGRCDCTLSLCDWDICSMADTPPCRPALFQSWASPLFKPQTEMFPLSLLHLLDWSQYTAAPGAITDMLRPSVKPLSATYQHTNFPLWKLAITPHHFQSPPLPECMILELFWSIWGLLRASFIS